MSVSEFWATTGAGVLSGIVATLLAAFVIWLLGRIRNAGSSANPSPNPSPAGPVMNVTDVSGSRVDGGVVMGPVSGGFVHSRIRNDNRRKRVDRRTTHNTTNFNASPPSDSTSGSDAWVWVVVAAIAVFVAAVLFVRFSDFAFLGAVVVFGLTVGAFVGTLTWPFARGVNWNRGATLTSVQVVISVAGFVLIWFGMFHAQRSGWSLSSMRDAVTTATSGVPLSQAVSAASDALGASGIQLAMALLAGALASFGLAVMVAVQLARWWWYLAAAAGRLRKKRAKRARRFSQTDAAAILITVVAPIFLAALGIASVWGLFPTPQL